MNENKRQVRKKLREELDVRSDANRDLIPAVGMNEKDFFVLHTNQLWYLDKMRTAMVNQTRSAIVEKIIKESKLYSEIVIMRRDQTADKKETAKLIKKALKECGWTEDMVTKERDALLNIDKSYHALDIAKTELAKKLKYYLEQQPIYTNWLEQVRGISVLLASKLLRIVGDIERFDKPSSLWHYFGLHVVDGKAPKLAHGKQATFSPRNRALAYLIAQGQKMSRGQFRQYYDNYKIQDAIKHPDYRKFYLDTRALRYCAKMFLLEFWIASYQAKGLVPPRKPYSAKFHPNTLFQPLVSYPQ